LTISVRFEPFAPTLQFSRVTSTSLINVMAIFGKKEPIVFKEVLMIGY